MRDRLRVDWQKRHLRIDDLMIRINRKKCLVWAIVLGVVAIIAFAPIMTLIWDGGFQSAEYRVTFLDESGKAVPGVTLKVITQAGGVCYGYPVNEHVPDSAPTSGDDGVMVFHHASHALEFGGRERLSLACVAYGETDAPQYFCLFMLNGYEVHRVRFDDLHWRSSDQKQTVGRNWKSSDWYIRALRERNDDRRSIDGVQSTRLALFDGNRDGILDREERTAAGYVQRDQENTVTPKEHTFILVEHTFHIKRP